MTREKIQAEAEKVGLVAIGAAEYEHLKMQQRATPGETAFFTTANHQSTNSQNPITMRAMVGGSDNESWSGPSHAAKPSVDNSISSYNNAYYDPTVGEENNFMFNGNQATTSKSMLLDSVPLKQPKPHISEASLGDRIMRMKQPESPEAPSMMNMSAFTIGTNASLQDRHMISLITQVVIGEYLFKYTRRRGLSGISENRHERYFWVHPYTLTLYWSQDNPAIDARNNGKAKSVAIIGVQTEEDANPLPPGLFHKSIIIQTSEKKTLKLTCPTRQRHNIWYGALLYLLKRSEEAVSLAHDNDIDNFSIIDDDDNDSIIDDYMEEVKNKRYRSAVPPSPGTSRMSSFRQGIAPEMNRMRTSRTASFHGISGPSGAGHRRQSDVHSLWSRNSDKGR